MAAAQLVFGGGIALQAPRQPLYLKAQKTTSNKGSSSSSSSGGGSSNSGGSGGGFLDWLIKSLDKPSFSETDPILNPGNGAAEPKPVKKNAPVDEDKKGGLLGGLFSKN